MFSGGAIVPSAAPSRVIGNSPQVQPYVRTFTATFAAIATGCLPIRIVVAEPPRLSTRTLTSGSGVLPTSFTRFLSSLFHSNGMLNGPHGPAYAIAMSVVRSPATVAVSGADSQAPTVILTVLVSGFAPRQLTKKITNHHRMGTRIRQNTA